MSYATRCRMRKNSGALPFYAVLSALALLLLCASPALARTIRQVPGDYGTIQAAIDAAQDGDTIEVAAGTYYENLVWENKSIDLVGAGADLTIIDGSSAAGSCLAITNVPDTGSVEGFTFTGGTGTPLPWGDHLVVGGGLSLRHSSPTVTKNTIMGNSAGYYGGGMYLEDSSPTVTGNTISGNSAHNGGGIMCHPPNSSPEILDNTISGNSTSGSGGGILCLNSSPRITGNTISGNSAESNGGGMDLWSSSAEITDNVITGNTALACGGIRATGSGLVRIDGNVITENLAHGSPDSCGIGGGIKCSSGCSAEITNNTISGNRAECASGGIGCNECPSVMISDNTITGNSAGWSAGITCTASSVTITNNTISENSTESWGGGIVCHDGSSGVISGNTITRNSAKRYAGIQCSQSSMSITNNIISENSASGDVWSIGGGIGYSDCPSGTLEHNTITGNSAEHRGGGVCCSESSVTITNNTISENSADGWGGGLACTNGSSGVISGNTITRNSAKRYAGIQCSQSSMSITNNIISENSASGDVWSIGGGIGYSDCPSGTLEHNTITGNSAEHRGGGVCCSESSVTITGNTIAGNSAGWGGGLYIRTSSPTVTNNTIASNTGGGLDSWSGSPLITNCILWGNLVADDLVGASANYSDVGTGNTGGGTGNISADPKFVDPANGDFHLQAGSPCIDAGTDLAPELPDTDLDGNPRIVGVAVDMGAYEFQMPWNHKAVAAILALIDQVEALNLQQGIDNSLDAKLESALNALDDINDNNNAGAVGSLQAFMNAVEAQRGNKILDADADALIAAIEEIILLLLGL